MREDAAEKICVTEFAGDFAECGERAFQFLGSQFRETSFSQAQRGSIEPCARGPQRFDVAGARREHASFTNLPTGAVMQFIDQALDAGDRKSTSLNSRHSCAARMPSSACKKK